LLDYKKLEISQDAKDAHKIADEAIEALKSRSSELEAAQALSGQAKAFDRRRLARIEAIRLMIESVEAAYLKSADVQTSAQQLLKSAKLSLETAVDYETGDILTFTIFRKTGSVADEKMEPIARAWTGESENKSLGRTWGPGEGYTGFLWSLARDNRKASLVDPDTQRVGTNKYKVENVNLEREARYRSVVSLPVLVGQNNEIWGIVTATSSRPGVFDHHGDQAIQSVGAVRDIAMIAGLLAKLRAT